MGLDLSSYQIAFMETRMPLCPCSEDLWDVDSASSRDATKNAVCARAMASDKNAIRAWITVIGVDAGTVLIEAVVDWNPA